MTHDRRIVLFFFSNRCLGTEPFSGIHAKKNTISSLINRTTHSMCRLHSGAVHTSRLTLMKDYGLVIVQWAHFGTLPWAALYTPGI